MPIPKNEFFIAFLAHMPKLSLVATKNRFPAHHLDPTAPSQPELGGNQIVRFVTKQAPAPQALIFLGGAREGEEGRVLY